MSDDLRTARVYVSAYGDEKARASSLQGLKAAATYLRRQVSHELELRFAPTLHFDLDETLLHARRLDQLLLAAAEGTSLEAVQQAAPPDTDQVFVPRQEDTTLAGTSVTEGPSPQAAVEENDGPATPLAAAVDSLRRSQPAGGASAEGRPSRRHTGRGSVRKGRDRKRRNG